MTQDSREPDEDVLDLTGMSAQQGGILLAGAVQAASEHHLVSRVIGWGGGMAIITPLPGPDIADGTLRAAAETVVALCEPRDPHSWPDRERWAVAVRAQLAQAFSAGRTVGYDEGREVPHGKPRVVTLGGHVLSDLEADRAVAHGRAVRCPQCSTGDVDVCHEPADPRVRS